MSSPELNREEVSIAISQKLGMDLSTVTVLFHTLVSERLGLAPTDHKAFNYIEHQGPLTAGALAKLTGLTTGAITGVVDRLERAGHVERIADLGDRRKVMVVARTSAEREAIFAEVFAPLAQAMARLSAQYSEDELTAIHSFMQESVTILQEQIARLQANARDEAG